MKNIHYYFIIALLSVIIGLLNIDYHNSNDIYNVRFDEGYISSSKTLNSNTSFGNNVPMNSVLPTSNKPVGTPINVPPVLKQDEYMSAAFEYSLGDARLIGEAGCMREDVALSINPIENNQLPPLNQGMVNVTGDNTGYRMLPKGMVFKNDIDIILPYDTTLLPIGFTPNDIKTYYYDERFKRWIEIERDSVDEANQLVISKVNHFTDFINAVLKTPEMPETSAYAPTQMNDIKAANPLEGMTLMQPPTANNSGTVSMSYPIEIPAGRQGLQPSLALSYNGGTASSWVGVGWDLSIPAISVETRWGVPRYNDTLESELYLLEGQQLVTKNQNGAYEDMPHRTNKWKLRANNPNETQFYPRINETFDSIVRHGTNPTNYWWSVTDRNGITSYYGKMHDSDNIDSNAILTDANNNIAHWGLTETRDINGNSVRYYYSIVYRSGNINSTQLGKNIYIDSINYTGFVNSSNVYEHGVNTVVFDRSALRRKDANVSCNYGFKQVCEERLCQIYFKVENCTTIVYTLRHQLNANSLYKTILTDITKGTITCRCRFGDHQDTNNVGIRTHFDYQSAPSQLFGAEETIQAANDGVQIPFIINPSVPFGLNHATALGATKGKSWSVGGTGTIGFGPDVSTTLLSAGGNFDYSQSSSEGLLTMIDLNGDGLSDKVFKQNGKIWYRPMLRDSQGNQYLGGVFELEGLQYILKESSESTSWGLQASIVVLSANASWGSTTSFTNIYFSDVNADGLPDLITDDGVLFNSIENGVPTFRNYILEQMQDGDPSNDSIISTSGSGDCGGIIFDGAVNDSIACHLELEYITTIQPYQISGFLSTQLPLTEDDFQFFIDADGKFCEVYLKKIICEPVLKNPDLDLVKVWVAPRAGTISVHSLLQMLHESYEPNMESKYANGVRYTIEVCNTINPTNSYLINAPDNQTISSGYILRGDYDLRDTTFTMDVPANAIIFFRLQSNGNRTFDNVSWIQEVEYLSPLAQDPTYNYYNSSNDYLVTGQHYFVAPEDGYLDYTLKVETGYLYGQTVNLVVEKIGVPIYVIPLSNNMNMSYINTTGLLTGDSVKLFVRGTAPKNHHVWSNIRIKPMYEYYSSGPAITERLNYYPSVNYEQVHQIGTNRLDTVFYGLFGPLYRGWGQFCYNNNYTNGSITDPIAPSTLRKSFTFISQTQQDFEADIEACPDTSSFDPNVVSSSYTSQGKYAPLSVQTRWVEMLPYSYQQTWSGFGNINYICKDTMSNGHFKTINPDLEVSDIETFDHPVPLTANPNQVKTVRKQTISSNSNKGCNINLGVSVGGSYSKGGSHVQTDYMDMNGDRYPDIVGDVYVQYSKPWGGIGDMEPLDKGVQGISHDTNNSWGVTFGASYPKVKKTVSFSPRGAKATVEGSGNSSTSYSSSTSKTWTNYMDVNGDGLPDKIDEQGYVALNIGYGFLPKEDYKLTRVREGSSNNIGVSGGVSFDVSQRSISGGAGLNYSDNKTERTIMDFNGDGIVDIVYKNGNNLYVQYRLGDGSLTPAENIGEYQISYGITSNESINLGFNIGFTWGWAKFGVGIQGTPYGKSFTKDKVQLVDINGDGYLDYVTSDDESTIKVKYNQTEQTNLLKKVTNFTGSTIELEYEPSKLCYNSPQKTWMLTGVKTNDPYSPVGGRTSYTTYEYKNPYYNRYERISYGYDTVITYQYDTENGDALYRKTIQGYNNKSFIKKGKKTCETICDATGKVYVETFYDVDILDADGQSIGDEPCPQLYFPNRVCEVTNYYEGMPTPQITTKKCVTYDSKKNVIEYFNVVDSASSVVDDNLRAEITYKTGMPNNMISLVESIIVYNKNNDVVREKSAEYSTNGKLTKIIQYNGTDQAEIDFEYDPYGNVTKMTFPENVNQQRMWNQYVYDPVVHSFPISVSNSLGYQSSAQYDYKWGKPTSTIDVNGQEMRYTYDYLGRTTTITGPNELADSALYTLKMEYFPVNYNRWNIFTPSIDTFSYARTFHYMANDPSNPIQTTILCDGLGRVIQTKKDIEIDGLEMSVVSGRVVLDSYGRTIKQYHPVTEPLTQYNKFNYSYDLNTATTTQFDVLDRELSITLPNNTTSYMQYTFGNDAFGVKRFLTITTDPNGNRVKTYTDPRKLQSTLIVDSTTVTNFVYNALGELIQSTDPNNHSTFYAYNNFGQKTSRIHPDAGTDLFTYDLAGNLISRQTQDLINNSMTINYDYHYNQMISIQYPKNPENNVHYFYGDNSAPDNRKGRVWAIEDASGRQEFSYGRMGEVVKNIRTFALPNESNTYTFAMKFEYDSWNRILGTTYPDGEHLRYWYNTGGQLSKMASSYNNMNYNYIDSITYNKFEKRTKICYGNGTKAEYGYDILQRLVNLKSTSASGIMQKIEYSFDHVNNIKRIDNVAGVLSNGLGGTYRHEYQYDNTYRLTSSNGSWDNNNNSISYNLNLAYTMDGRIQTKTQSGSTLIGGNLSSFSYDNQYSYNTNQPHTVRWIDDNVNQAINDFKWDANGNLIFHKYSYPENITRQLCWDEENRLMAVGDNKYTSYYVYDNGGERTYKLTGPNTYMNINGSWMNFAQMNNPTLYTSAYLVAGVQGYTKHYYAGSERVSSAIGLGGLSGIDRPLMDPEFWDKKGKMLNKQMDRVLRDCIGVLFDADESRLDNLYFYKNAESGKMSRYFYHPDHLGSSSWITDNTGRPIQHLHYLPFGEDWVDQRNSNWNAPYTFSGKEKDVETGYGYFGARYYDSGLSIWLSVDPMSDKYPSMSPYNYCANNPVILVDPDGRYPWPISYKYDNGTRDVISGMYRNTGGAYHGAVDIVHKTSSGNISGGTVYATHGGTVTQSGNSETAGNWIQITNGDIRTTYMHLENEPTQKVGDNVTELTKIGTVGTTGKSEGPHLHYQIEMYNSETEEWEKVNPVVGQPDKVSSGDDVNLYDPQKYIDWREGKTPGSSSANPATLNEQEVKSTCEEQNN